MRAGASFSVMLVHRSTAERCDATMLCAVGSTLRCLSSHFDTLCAVGGRFAGSLSPARCNRCVHTESVSVRATLLSDRVFVLRAVTINAFTRSGNLSRHMRTHTDVRQYACVVEGCDRRFSEPSGLARCMRIHTYFHRLATNLTVFYPACFQLSSKVTSVC